MKQEEIEQGFANAGWEIDGGFYNHLAIGYTDALSILAYRKTWKTGEPESQLCDHDDSLDYWVEEIPTPEQAARLLRKHGKPLDE